MAKNSIDSYNAEGKTNLLMFDPDKLHLVTDPNHPLYDERVHLPVDEALVLNIMFQGVIQAITVVKDPETGTTDVGVGRQRVKACREANRRLRETGREPIMIPGVPKKLDEAGAMGMMISENEIRKDDTPLGRAKKMRDYLNKTGRTEADLTVLFGCSAATVKNTLGLLDATQAVRDAVEAGRITVTNAYQLAKLEPEEQRAKLAEVETAGQGLVGKAKARKVREAVAGAPTPPSKAKIREMMARCTGPAAVALAWVLGDPEEPCGA